MAERDKSKAERPILQFSVLCDGIATPKQTGDKPVFAGIFSSIVRPMTVPQFFIANRWINGAGEHSQVVKILDPDLKEIAKTEEQNVSLPSPVYSADVINGFINFNFPRAGVYWIKIELDGQTAMSYPLPVFEGK